MKPMFKGLMLAGSLLAGSCCGDGISWPLSQLLHWLFFFESIRAGAENTGSQALAQVRCKRARGARMGRGVWPAPGEGCACGVPCA